MLNNMLENQRLSWGKVRELIMRFGPVSIALSLLATVSASVGYSQGQQQLDPRAAALQAQGRSALAAGDTDRALDGFEAALAVQPGSSALVLDLADVARAQGMQGKALHYYRTVLEREPQTLAALAGEGAALAEKGAIEKARRNLARLEGLCGRGCGAAQTLATAIARGPAPRVVSADAVKPVLEANN